MSRRARQNKAPNSSLDLKPTTINWNVNSVSVPSFKNTLKRDNRPYTVMQISNQGTVMTSATSIPTFYGRYFSANDVIQFSSFAAVFDQYKIDTVEVWMTPFGSASAPGYNANCRIYSAVDYDDANTPTSINAIQQYENSVVTRSTDGHYIKFVPHIAVAAYGGTFTQFKNEKTDWIDVASTNTSFYGLKAAIDPTSSTGDLKVDLVTRLTVSFRNVF